MATVTIYTTQMCPYCIRAIRLLRKKGAKIEEISAGWNPKKKAEMIARSNGGRTFPQIFIGEKHIGGCDDLYALEQRGGLDSLLR